MDYKDKPYLVFDTPCFPARWHVSREPKTENNVSNYFRDYGEALEEAERRNERRKSNIQNNDRRFE